MIYIRVSQATYRTALEYIGLAFEIGSHSRYNTAIWTVQAVSGLEA